MQRNVDKAGFVTIDISSSVRCSISAQKEFFFILLRLATFQGYSQFFGGRIEIRTQKLGEKQECYLCSMLHPKTATVQLQPLGG